jgi:nitroreductase
MGMKDLVTATRSYRRFKLDEISLETLRELVDLARLSPSGGNMQPLRYIISNDAATNAKIFPCTEWAGYFKDWDGPAEGERPAAYIIILHDKEAANSAGCDHGIAAQSIVLGACEQGIGACMIGSIHRNDLADTLNIDERYKIMLVIALGVPAERVILDIVGADGDIKYFRDNNGVHHVPKHLLDDIIIVPDIK